MSTLTTINASDLITNSRADINANFVALNSEKVETSTIDTDTTLAANSDSKIPTQKAVKAYVDAGGNVNASETTKGIVEEATDAEVTAGTATGGTGAKLFVTPAKLATRLADVVAFGGDGSDGALTVASGNTNVDLGGARQVIKNYSSISITGTGSVTFTNPHANGSYIYIKCSGAFTLTSSTAPALSAVGCGGTGGAAATVVGAGTAGTASKHALYVVGGGAAGDNTTSTHAGGAKPASFAYDSDYASLLVPNKFSFLIPGGGGGGGGEAGGGTPVAAAGGSGGGVLIVEVAGEVTFSTTGGVSASGAAGGNASGSGEHEAGGGGGGGGGCCLFRYKSGTITGTVVASGGAGGTDSANAYSGASTSGAGGGSGFAAGSNSTTDSNGGAGGAGLAITEIV